MGRPWALDTVMWYWSADTLSWQLSIEYNMDMQYHFAGSHYLEGETFHICFSVVQTNGRAGGRTVMLTAKISWMDR